MPLLYLSMTIWTFGNKAWFNGNNLVEDVLIKAHNGTTVFFNDDNNIVKFVN